jgi:hypothetical protein
MSKSALSKILIDGNRSPREIGPESKSPHEGSTAEQAANPEADHPRHASLYDDTLSNRSGSRWSSLIWGFFALIIVAGVVAVFLGSSADQRVLDLAENKARAASESELSNVVTDARDRDAASENGAVSPAPETPRQNVAAQPEATTPPPAPPVARRNSTPPPAEAAAATTPATSSPGTAKPPTPKPATPTPAEAKPTTTPAQETTPSSPADSAREATSNPVLLAEPGQSVEENEEAPAQEPAGPPPEDKAAYDALIQNSQVAAKIVVGAFPTLTYQSWRIVQKNEREIWVDLIANWTDGGSEVHFIWAVTRDGKKVRALSEAARNLERED